ncbi:MAG: aspartate aminotransferase family protein [Solirubrobacterales bacterium]|nr:aspartate aminotransferase family protein [Solirubrobacterales bacterium]
MPIPEISEILTTRRGEEMALNDRFMNQQLGRVLRTLGMDKSWVGADHAHLIDADGNRYLDLVSGHGVFALGRAHPEVVSALEQVMAAGTANLPQLGVTLLPGVLAEALLALAPASVSAVIPSNSGTEAVEAAIKVARVATGRRRIVYADHAFHGLSLGSLSVNGAPEFRDGFGPLLPDCVQVPYGNIDAVLRELERGGVAGVILEPIQGKGVHVPPEGYLAEVQRACKRAGALFICDEVQTGAGRTGRFLALEHWELQPDVITMAKALSGGFVPIGATLVSRKAYGRLYDGMENAVRHSSTFGGNDLAAAAALATLRVFEREGVVAHAKAMGDLLMELTLPLVGRYEIVRQIRGRGLMWGIELQSPSGGAGRRFFDAAERAQPGIFAQLITVPLFHQHRVLVQVAGHQMNVIKALPSLLISEDEVRYFAAALEDVIASAERTPQAFAKFGVGMARGSLKAALGPVAQRAFTR